MNLNMRLIDGWWWPDGETGTGGIRGIAPSTWIEQQQRDAEHYSKITQRKGTVVCAGAHIGIMPDVYSKHFQHVICFEPDQQNWPCLLRNLRDHSDDVQCIHGALAHRNGEVEMVHNVENSGASHCAPPEKPFDEKCCENINCMPLDTFKFRALDLLQLDVEGFEYFALQGAIESIRIHLPVIVIEHNSCAKRYGHQRADIELFLRQFGYSYSPKLSIGCADHVYTNPENHGG